jgi:phosphate starvation-inducible membrane PsiE
MQVKIFQKQGFVCDGRHIPVRFIIFIGKEAMINLLYFQYKTGTFWGKS